MTSNAGLSVSLLSTAHRKFLFGADSPRRQQQPWGGQCLYLHSSYSQIIATFPGSATLPGQPGGLNTQINDTKVVWAIPTGTLNSPGLICLFRSERSQFRWNLGRVFQSKGQPGSFSHVTLSVNYNWWGICYSLGHFLLSSSFLKNFTVSPTILIQVIGSITKERKAPNPRKPSRWQIMNLFVWEVSSQKPFFEETAGVCKETSRCRWSFKVHEHQCGKGSTPVGRTYQQRK